MIHISYVARILLYLNIMPYICETRLARFNKL